MILPLFGGVMLDNIGISSGLILFSFFVTVGQLIFTIGGY